MKHLLTACAALALSGCATESTLRGHARQHCNGLPHCLATLVVSNPSEYARPDEILRFSYDELGVADGPVAALSADEVPVASQDLDTDGDGAADSVLLLVDLPAGGSETIFIVHDAAPPLRSRSHAEISGEENGVSTADQRDLAPRVRLSTVRSAEISEAPLTAELAVNVSQRLARSERARRSDTLAFSSERSSRRGGPVWTYTTGLLMQAIDDVGAAVGDPTLQDYASDVIASFVDEHGGIRTYKVEEHNIDMINSGLMLLRLLERRNEARFQTATDRVASQFKSHPRTSEGAFWHKQIYPHQLWLDGLYMGMPFLAAIGQRRGDEAAFADVVNAFQVARSRLRDPATGLYFHGWDEARAQDWANPRTGLSSQVWGRGLGWFAMALVDTLDYLPAHRTDLRAPLLGIISELAPALVEHQTQTGVWYQIIDRPEALGNYREASASAMFVYFLAKAINKGYLPDSYREAALRGYDGMLDEFVTVDADGEVHLRNICEVAGLGYGRDGSYRYYMSEPVVANDPKGVGPMMMAGLQIAELLRRQ
jgi:unsaturated rhamnogalacturonyl hydrolase